ncbi:GatB/YqeY domain-containing protein [Thalassotalea agarivorans]|uniref:Glutamyl-tRNA amidotransferase n=1 Tax=Thalassotalea agarivorans TaxID=349064 RepID=A0A1H9Y9A3_THASX|nr:GatB/YqeY domain-containing protein [Thalassotalea agarivorans]SES65521.1 hypothetical protein SAMN05660429_00133 [Thalassotalea agarivorans]
MSLLEQLKDEMKNAMRAKDKIRLGAIRMALSAVKQAEIDNKVETTDDSIIAVLTKMVKQRKESIAMFTDGGREDMAAQEAEEVKALEFFLPQPLSNEEVEALIAQAIASTGASSMADMGKVMGLLKPQLQGRADLGQASGKVRSALNS